jgi:hypothetical protein
MDRNRVDEALHQPSPVRIKHKTESIERSFAVDSVNGRNERKSVVWWCVMARKYGATPTYGCHKGIREKRNETEPNSDCCSPSPKQVSARHRAGVRTRARIPTPDGTQQHPLLSEKGLHRTAKGELQSERGRQRPAGSPDRDAPWASTAYLSQPSSRRNIHPAQCLRRGVPR